MCYAAVAIATNYAAGISPHALTHTEVEERMAQRLGDLQRLFRRCAELYTPDDCSCRHALDEYRRRLGRPDLTILR
jgi:5'-methylthioadenosine phosphorylase